MVHIEHLTSGLYLEKREDVDLYAAAINRLFIDAEPPGRTPEILREILLDLEPEGRRLAVRRHAGLVATGRHPRRPPSRTPGIWAQCRNRQYPPQSGVFPARSSDKTEVCGRRRPDVWVRAPPVPHVWTEATMPGNRAVMYEGPGQVEVHDIDYPRTN